jgi:histidinol-phosphate/aromatic aminotransferase/cobyric acid decarboxylase-like protein
VAPPEIVRRLDDERPPWSVNALAQAAAMAMTSEAAGRFVEESRDRLLTDRAELGRALAPLPLDLHPSDTIFLLLGLRGGRLASELRATLLQKHHVLVRDCASFGLPHHIRIGARPPSDRARLLSALTRELS